MLQQNPFMAKVAENTLDRARQAGLITYDQYKSMGGRDIVPGIQRGNEALMRVHNIKQTSDAAEMADLVVNSNAINVTNPKYKNSNIPLENRRAILGDALKQYARRDIPGLQGTAFASQDANALYSRFSENSPRGVPELVTRHEIDEIRYGKNPKRTLKSVGHNEPRVITNEHRLATRIKDPLVDVLRANEERPIYYEKTKGRFNYGRGTSQIPDKKFWAETAKQIADEKMPATKPTFFGRVRDALDARFPQESGPYGLPDDLFDNPQIMYAKARNVGYLGLHKRDMALAGLAEQTPEEIFEATKGRKAPTFDVLRTDPEIGGLIQSKLDQYAQSRRPIPLLKQTAEDVGNKIKQTARNVGNKIKQTAANLLPNSAPEQLPAPSPLTESPLSTRPLSPKMPSADMASKLRASGAKATPITAPSRKVLGRQIPTGTSKIPPATPKTPFKGIGTAIGTIAKGI